MADTPTTALLRLERVWSAGDAVAMADRLARECADLAGYRRALLSVTFDDLPVVGAHALTEEEIAYFRASATRGSLHERRVNRRRLRERAFPGTGIAYVRGATGAFNVLPTPGSTPDAAWGPDDAVYVLVRGADGEDIGVLSFDSPEDGRPPTEGALARLQAVEALLPLACALVESRLLRDRAVRAEQELTQVQKLDALGRLACEVAHDVNNLLTVINGFADLARDDASPDSAAHLDGILEASHRSAALTHRILAFGRPHDRTGRHDLSAFLGDAEELLRRALGPDHTLRLDLAAEPLLVEATHAQLTQIVLNLVVNARDAMPGGGTVRIRTYPHRELATAFVTLQVEDEGVGMDEATLARVFEPFYTTKSEGSGLGLATVRRIVARLGGRTEIESRPAIGTVVRVRLAAAD